MYLKAIYLVLSLLCLVNAVQVIDTPIHEMSELLARFVLFGCLGVVGLGFIGCAIEGD